VTRRRLRNGLRACLRIFGLDIVRFNPAESPDARRAAVLEQEGVDLVLDIGANSGQFATRLRSHGYHGKIVSFEPLRDAFAQLNGLTNFDQAWECVNIAVGADARTAVLHVAGNSWSSSLLPMEEAHLRAAPESAYVAQEEVPVRPLDSFGYEGRLYIKIDVQGAEADVLAGASRTLAFCRAIEIELCTVPLYQGQALLPELWHGLYEGGFRAVSLAPAFRDAATGELLAIDGIFVRGSGGPPA
jgi:FkbM family methyltransferase